VSGTTVTSRGRSLRHGFVEGIEPRQSAHGGEKEKNFQAPAESATNLHFDFALFGWMDLSNFWKSIDTIILYPLQPLRDVLKTEEHGVEGGQKLSANDRETCKQQDHWCNKGLYCQPKCCRVETHTTCSVFRTKCTLFAPYISQSKCVNVCAVFVAVKPMFRCSDCL
jgi:hypothetical protein